MSTIVTTNISTHKASEILGFTISCFDRTKLKKTDLNVNKLSNKNMSGRTAHNSFHCVL